MSKIYLMTVARKKKRLRIREKGTGSSMMFKPLFMRNLSIYAVKMPDFNQKTEFYVYYCLLFIIKIAHCIGTVIKFFA